VSLHFAYGSNMSRPLMQHRCPTGHAIGTAAIRGWRFIIMRDGFASIVPEPGGIVYGVLWRLGPRDLAAINAYESLDSGLYVQRTLPVRHRGRMMSALVFVSGRRGEGRPRAGYMAVVEGAARDWDLPAQYIESLRRWAPSELGGARWKDTGEVG
jgi:hypothetical protein